MHPLIAAFTSSFLQDPALDAAVPVTASTAEGRAHDPWWYQPGSRQSPEAFARGNGFDRFASSLSARISALAAIVGTASIEADAFVTFQAHVLDVDSKGANRHFGDAAGNVYGEGAQYLDRLVHLIGDPRLTPETRITALRELAPQLVECGNGAVVALQQSVARLDPDGRGLRGKCRTLMELTIEQVAAEVLDRRHARALWAAPGMHRHHVAGLQTRLYGALGLPWRPSNDPMAKATFPTRTIESCLQQLGSVLTPSALALTLAEDYLARCTEALRDAGACRPDAPLTIGEIDAGTLTLLHEFNVTPTHDALVRVDADAGSCVLQDDPILVGLQFLEELSKADVVHAACHEPVASWIDGSGEPVQCFVNGALSWAVQDGRPRPLIASDLPGLATLTVAPLNAAARRSLRLASTPSALAAHVDPRLLRDADTCTWLCDQFDDAGLASLLSDWHARQAWTPEQFTWIAHALAAQGRVDLFTSLPFDWPANARLAVIVRALDAKPPKLDPGGLRQVLAMTVQDQQSLLECVLLKADLPLCCRFLDALTTRARAGELEIGTWEVFTDAAMEKSGIAARLYRSTGTYCSLTRLFQHRNLQGLLMKGTSSPRQLATDLLPPVKGIFPRVIDTNDEGHVLAALLAVEVIGKYAWGGDKARGRHTLRALLEGPGRCASGALQRLHGPRTEDLFIALLAETLRAMRRLSFSREEARALLRIRPSSASAKVGEILDEVARQIDSATDDEQLPESLDDLLTYTLAR